MTLYCVCKGGRNKLDGYVAIPVDNLLWVHSACGRPTRMVFEKVTMNRAPRGARALLSEYGRANGVHELTFSMEGGEKKTILTVHPYDRRPLEMGINPNDVLLRTWEMLDAQVEIIKKDPGNRGAQFKGRALSEVLALFMAPFFTDPDEIVREGVRRYDNRDNPEYETPGVGQRMLAQFDKMPMAKKPDTKKVEVRLSEELQGKLRKALDSGLFTAEQLAKSYGVSVEVIKAIPSA